VSSGDKPRERTKKGAADPKHNGIWQKGGVKAEAKS